MFRLQSPWTKNGVNNRPNTLFNNDPGSVSDGGLYLQDLSDSEQK